MDNSCLSKVDFAWELHSRFSPVQLHPQTSKLGNQLMSQKTQIKPTGGTGFEHFCQITQNQAGLLKAKEKPGNLKATTETLRPSPKLITTKLRC